MTTYQEFKKDLSYWFRLFLIFWFGIIGYQYFFVSDNTDKDSYNKSGLKLHTDYKTGLQYLSSQHGGLIPRINIDGKHMNIKEN